MAEYIERETALRIIDNYAKTVTDDGLVVVNAIKDIVSVICPTADVEPVKHAAFVRDEEHWYICGNCHHATCSEFDLEGEYQKIEIGGKVRTIHALKQPNYCKHCGAKMDGKEVQE